MTKETISKKTTEKTGTKLTKEQLIEDVFKKYTDPELGIDVWTLGLIYKIEIKKEEVYIQLTFTSPLCPYGPQMVEELRQMILQKGAKDVKIEITFEPAWKPSDELREMMGV